MPSLSWSGQRTTRVCKQESKINAFSYKKVYIYIYIYKSKRAAGDRETQWNITEESFTQPKGAQEKGGIEKRTTISGIQL